MTENKDVKQGSVLRSVPLLAAANVLFFCLEFILAIEARSASLFADSIAFLEGASVSVLLSSGHNWSMPGREAFARFSSTIILIPTCFLFWMIAANYYGAAIPSAMPLAATDRKSTRLNSSHANISYAVFCLKYKDPRFVILPNT